MSTEDGKGWKDRNGYTYEDLAKVVGMKIGSVYNAGSRGDFDIADLLSVASYIGRKMGWATAGSALGCDVPPRGWVCSRDKGHEGPCAATECHGCDGRAECPRHR